ncbi:hypothetical protein CAE01nite_10570 [Cellulomonas aerilata]|uniref:D-inositol 3-phosphate glycosyltransferase n=1 Tax=Cellulomonas aerilata TaxID=515326 RepID=A0A512DA23_9CELL|nr:hypothetical protein CAE01nite_10570 [Cellulomonas aerilata]
MTGPGTTVVPPRAPGGHAARTDAHPRGFAPPGTPVDVGVVVVTHRSAADVDAVLTSVRGETATVSLRVVVVDNGSRDGTLDVVRSAHPDVVTVGLRENLGYAGGINVGVEHLGECRAVLVLNADLVLQPGSIAALLRRLDAGPAGIVVPRMLDRTGALSRSLRREPSLLGTLGDALVGGRWHRRRPAWLSETVLRDEAYGRPHPVAWATGAALLVRSSLARSLGPWHERYFLYSEETEYCRRARDAGSSIWYEPAAVVVHAGGGSGTSPGLTALSSVNRVRYVRRFRSRPYAAAFRVVVVLAELLRVRRPAHRRALRAVLTPSSWDRLARADGAGGSPPATFGYLVPEFPGQTHGFFWRELEALRRSGARPVLLSTRRPTGTTGVHAWAAPAAARTRYLTDWSPGAAMDGVVVGVRAVRSGRSRDVVRELGTVTAAEGPVRAGALLLAGARLAVLARREGLPHVHVHSCAGAAQVATFARLLGGPTYSLSLHGPLADYGGNQRGKWRHASFGLVITDPLHRDVVQALDGDLPATLAVAPMGIDPGRFVRTRPYVPCRSGGPLRIVSCGRLNPSKGHVDLVRAVRALADAGRDVRLVVAGEDEHGGAGYRRELEREIARLRLGDRVRLLGTVGEDDVRAQLESAHVFALASHAEPLGVAIMEAMALCLPVVVCDGGGVRALVEDGRTGLLATPGDPGSIAAAVGRLADDPTLATTLGTSARRHVESAFASERSARTLLELVERTCAAGSGT